MSESDVVQRIDALLDLWRAAVAERPSSAGAIPAISPLLQEARDEIVALRKERDEYRLAWAAERHNRTAARAAALEEAASICDREARMLSMETTPADEAVIAIALSVRALKDERHE